ncbi:sugar ABC transporter permease [Streptococcus pneumoniae]|nr:sugar ABC transporter permease [Streptococcus pneumoniae]
MKKVLQKYWAWAFVVIPLLLQAIFFYVPMFQGAFYSFTNWTGLTYNYKFVGLNNFNPNHSYLSQLDVTYKTPDLMSHFLPPHEVSFTFCCSSIVFPR